MNNGIGNLCSNQEQNIITSEKSFDLVILKGNKPVTTSLTLADYFGKQHKNVVRDIEQIIENINNFNQLKSEPVISVTTNPAFMFEESHYLDAKNESRKMYEMDRDGFTLLAMGFTGSKALQFKLQYIAAFNAMENQLRGEQPQPDQIPQNQDSKYFISFHNPSVVMSIKKKNCSDNHQRFIDFGAGVMFPVQRDNSIQMSDHQYNKVMDIIGMELKGMVNYGFSNGVFGQKDVRIDDATGTFPPVDKFAQLESTQKLLQIELSAATSQIEEMKALKVAEEAIRTKAHINNKKTASAMGKAGNLSKKNKKLLRENEKLKKMLAEKNIFEGVSQVNKF